MLFRPSVRSHRAAPLLELRDDPCTILSGARGAGGHAEGLSRRRTAILMATTRVPSTETRGCRPCPGHVPAQPGSNWNSISSPTHRTFAMPRSGPFTASPLLPFPGWRSRCPLSSSFHGALRPGNTAFAAPPPRSRGIVTDSVVCVRRPDALQIGTTTRCTSSTFFDR